MNAMLRILMLILPLGASVQVQAAALELTPANQGAALGDLVSVELMATGLGDGVAPSVGGFDLDILYDPAVLSFRGSTIGAALGVAEDFGTGDLGGAIDFAVLSLELESNLDLLQGTSVLLATLDFIVDALAEGAWTEVVIDSTQGGPLVSDGSSASLSIDSLGPARITGIAVPDGRVPTPAALLIMLPAILLLAVRR